MKSFRTFKLIAAAALVCTSQVVLAQGKYDIGANETEIKIGNIAPYSGPASAYGVIGRMHAAFFKMINEQGGINGRRINFISYDDGFSPPKAVEQARKLVESDEVFAVFNSIGTPSNSAIHKYMNAKKVPQIFIATGATKWGDPKNFPWTIGWQPNYQSEGRVYAKYLLKEHPGVKIGVLYQNDDFGKDLLKGLKDGLGSHVSLIVAEDSYEMTEPTIDTHIVKLKTANVGVLISMTTPKFGAQSIKKVAELGWKPVHIISYISSSISSIKPAGFENAQGILSSNYMKDASDGRWKDDAGIKKFTEFMDKYLPDADKTDGSTLYAFGVAQTLVHTIKKCGDDLTRENLMRQAANLKDLENDIFLPGIKINTSPTDFFPIEQFQMERLTGDHWEMFGDVLNGEVGG
jgi:branched-chain amino acid transport system substrate-binding protein